MQVHKTYTMGDGTKPLASMAATWRNVRNPKHLDDPGPRVKAKLSEAEYESIAWERERMAKDPKAEFRLAPSPYVDGAWLVGTVTKQKSGDSTQLRHRQVGERGGRALWQEYATDERGNFAVAHVLDVQIGGVSMDVPTFFDQLKEGRLAGVDVTFTFEELQLA